MRSFLVLSIMCAFVHFKIPTNGFVLLLGIFILIAFIQDIKELTK